MLLTLMPCAGLQNFPFAERVAEQISYGVRSPEILIQEMFKFCLSSCSWALWFSFWKKSHLQECVREMKAGISGKGQFCWHTQCMVSQRDIFVVIQVQTLFLRSQLCLPVWPSKPPQTLPDFLGWARSWCFMKLGRVPRQKARHIISCVCLTEDSLWAFINNNTLYYWYLSSKDMQILIGWAIPCTQLDGISLFVFV